jgi:hypothetical protein
MQGRKPCTEFDRLRRRHIQDPSSDSGESPEIMTNCMKLGWATSFETKGTQRICSRYSGSQHMQTLVLWSRGKAPTRKLPKKHMGIAPWYIERLNQAMVRCKVHRTATLSRHIDQQADS